MYTFKKIGAGDAPNRAMFPFQLLTWSVIIILTCVILTLFLKKKNTDRDHSVLITVFLKDK